MVVERGGAQHRRVLGRSTVSVNFGGTGVFLAPVQKNHEPMLASLHPKHEKGTYGVGATTGRDAKESST